MREKTVGQLALSAWNRLSPIPGGKWLFSRIVGWAIPYTGSVKPQVAHMEPGKAIVQLKDRRSVRNHLGSVHAIALANLAEFTTGLATLSGMPTGTRAILTALTINYHKKARGTLQSECVEVPMNELQDQSIEVDATVYDSNRNVVATATVTWLIGPEKHQAG